MAAFYVFKHKSAFSCNIFACFVKGFYIFAYVNLYTES